MEENKQVEKFDPSKLMDGVKDRIKASFVSLIPDEHWETMVKAEIDNFFKLKDSGYQQRDRFSDFSLLIQTELKEQARKILAEYLASPDFQVFYDNGKALASDAVKKMCIENSGEIMANMYAGMFASMMSNFRQEIINRKY